MGDSVHAYDSNSSDGEVQKVSQLSNEMCSLEQDENENLYVTCNQTQVKLDLSGGQKTEVCPWNESPEAKDMNKILDLSLDQTPSGVMSHQWLRLLRLSMIRDSKCRAPSMSELQLHQILEEHDNDNYPVISQINKIGDSRFSIDLEIIRESNLRKSVLNIEASSMPFPVAVKSPKKTVSRIYELE